MGCRVCVLAPHGPGAAFYVSFEGVEIHRYSYAWPWRLQQLCYAGGMLVNLRRRSWTRWLLPSLVLCQFITLLWQVLRFRPDVIHSHSLLLQGLIAAAVAAIMGVPHVTTSHGNDVFGLRRDGIMGAPKRATLAAADAVTANSSATRDAVRSLGCPLAKIHTIPAMPNAYPVRGELFRRIRADIIGFQSHCLLFVGRLIDDKGVGDLLNAMPRICIEFPATCLLIVGDGQQREDFMAAALHSESPIVFIGPAGCRLRMSAPEWPPLTSWSSRAGNPPPAGRRRKASSSSKPCSPARPSSLPAPAASPM